MKHLSWFLCLLILSCQPEPTTPPLLRFRKEILSQDFMAEGVAIADVDQDGQLDLMAGSHWWKGPNWEPLAYREPLTFDPTTRWSDAFLHFAMDVNGDGWTDLLRVDEPGKETVWYENPQGASGFWAEHPIDSNTCNESPALVNLVGDETPELVFGREEPGEMTWFSLDPSTQSWQRNVLAGPQAPGTNRYAHGLGTGDLNLDGKEDVLVKEGWWEQPADPSGMWPFHEVNFGEDCAHMLVWDVDQDGDQDVISSSAHQYGIWWHEQKGDQWTRHLIFDQVSQTHALSMADMDNDGQPDLLTGKRYYAHLGKDPGGNDPALLYVFLYRPKADGSPHWEPVLVDDDSGVGLQVLTEDLNQDGLLDIIVCNKKGLFIFWQEG